MKRALRYAARKKKEESRRSGKKREKEMLFMVRTNFPVVRHNEGGRGRGIDLGRKEPPLQSERRESH